MTRRLRLLVLLVLATALIVPVSQLPAQAASSVTISGSVAGWGPRPDGLRVYLWNPQRGLILNRGKTVAVRADGRFTLGGVALAKKNKKRKYYLSVRGEVNGVSHEWFYGGSKYINGATPVYAAKGGVTGVNFLYTSISGRVGYADKGGAPAAGTEVRVAAKPRNYAKLSSFDKRELDIPNCANDFITTLTDGNGRYTASFLPAGSYRLKFSKWGSGYLRQWRGSSAAGRGYQACTQVPTSGASRGVVNAGVTGPVNGADYLLRTTSASISGKITFTYSPTVHDRHITVREDNAERKVVMTGATDAKGNYVISKVPPGSYVLEFGRHSSCSTWLPTFNLNNNSYLEKGVSRWKSYTWPYRYDKKKYVKEPAKRKIAKPYYEKVNGVRVDGYGNPKPGAGKRGWMWRNHCRADGVAASRKVTVGDEKAQVRSVNTKKVKGASISGRILRAQTLKPKSEILVTVYAKGGSTTSKFTRTAITDRGGRFVVRGLQKGTYELSINADSWRGIGRGFGTGYRDLAPYFDKSDPYEVDKTFTLRSFYKQSMKVKVAKVGKRYSVGDLYTKTY